MAKVTTWVGYVAAVAMLLHLPLQMSRWRAARRVYGRVPWSLAWQMRVYSQKNRLLRIQLGLLGLMFVLLVPAIVNAVGADVFGVLRPYEEPARSLRLPVLLIFFWQFERAIGYLVPPTCLLLGTAKSVNIHLVAVLNNDLRPYRVVSLLDLREEHIFPLFVQAVMYNNIRTVNGHEWRTIVHHLMDVVPLIIVDTAVRTQAVDAELHRINRLAYHHRVVSFSSAAYGKEVNAIDSGIGAVVDAAQQMSKELGPQIRARLEHPMDIDGRWKAQCEYTAMLRRVPWKVRFHPEINAMLIKAHFVLTWTMENFLRECKQPVPGGHSSWLIEDIPSRVTRAEEDVYLRRSRGLDEVAGIASSALELALQTPGPQQQEFNIANAHNKLGKCARFSRDWNAALFHLGTALEMFGEMSQRTVRASSNPQEITRELADAHFLRGEVYMARYRQTASASDLANAAADFRASKALDDALEQDSSNTIRRLDSLAGGNEGRRA